MKIKIFKEDSCHELEKCINEWLEENKNVRITSIQFNERNPIAYIEYEVSHLDLET